MPSLAILFTVVLCTACAAAWATAMALFLRPHLERRRAVAASSLMLASAGAAVGGIVLLVS